MKKLVATLIMAIMVLSMSIILTACGSSVTLSAPQNVLYNGTTITWDKVENADLYKVTINDGKERSVSKPSLSFLAGGKEFTVKVVATNTTAKRVTEGETVMTFYPLGKITDVTWSEMGVATWSPIEGATGYIVKIDGQETDITLADTTFDTLPIGQHSFAVRAVVDGDDSYYSEWSSTSTVTKLGTVDKDSITYKDGTIKWASVSGAQKYEVTVNGETTTVTSSSMDFDSSNQNFDVSIKPIGNGSTTFTGTASDLKSFKYLETVTDIRIIDGILRWEEVADADGYELKLNNVSKGIINATEYSGLPANQSISVQLRPISDDSTYFSSWSAVQTVLILPAPELKWNNSIELDGQVGNNLHWDLVGQAAGYAVKIEFENSPEFVDSNISSTTTFYPYAFLEVGTYKVSLKAMADEDATNVSDSVYCEPLTIRRLAAPTAAATNYIKSNADQLSSGFTVTFVAPVGGATGYTLYKDEVPVANSTSTQFIEGNIVEDNVTSEQNFNYKIQAIGKYDAGQRKVILSSLTSHSLAFAIKVLPVPTNVAMDGYSLKYDSVSGAEGYAISVGSDTLPSENLACDLSAINAGHYDVKVCAKGNGSDVLASNFSAPIKVHRLDYPTNIRIVDATADNGGLTYNEVEGATSYDVFFNNSNIAATSDELKNINQYISEDGTYVHMTAVANCYKGTDYYMTSKPSPSQPFIKLKAPGFGNSVFTNDQFVWKHSGNMNTAEYTPTYQVANAQEVVYNGQANGTTFPIAHFDGGQEYAFKVRAIGNGTKYISSGWSETKVIWKLATPNVVKTETAYQWNAVARSTNYAVYVNGDLMSSDNVHKSGETYTYVHEFKLPGEYQVKVIAIGDNGYETINSNECLIEQVVKQLPAPDIAISYSNPAGYDENGKIVVEVVDITGDDVWANGYVYAVGGSTTPNPEGTTYEFNPNSTGTFYIAVQANGGRFDTDGVYWATSQVQGGQGTQYYITLLKAPNESEIILSQEFISWAAINGATAYEVEVSVNDGAFSEVKEFRTASCEIATLIDGLVDSYNDVQKLVIRIRAKGNGNKIISSTTTEKEWTNLH